MEKLIKDGKVGVIISRGWGSGFHTWNAPLEAIFNPQLIELSENENYDEATEFVKKTYPKGSVYGVETLCVEGVEEGKEL